MRTSYIARFQFKICANGCRHYIFRLLLLLFGLCLGLSCPSRAYASHPGDAYVFSAQSPVAPDGTSQQSGPSISGNVALWSESDSSLRKTRLFFKDLSKGPGEPGHALISSEYCGTTAEINQAGNRVVWSEMIGAQMHVYYKDVDFSGSFSGCTGTVDECATALSPVDYWQENPSISQDGSKVVWESGRGHGSQIHMYDFITGIEQELYGMPGGDQEYPSADDEWVVWKDNRDYNDFVFPLNQHIYASRIGSPDSTVSIADNGGSAHAMVGSAKIGRNLNNEPVVVYVKSDTGYKPSFAIRLHNLADGSDIQLAQSKGRLDAPSINGDKVVWLDCTENSRCDVMLHDLSTDVTQTVSQDPGLGANKPAVSHRSGYIAWRSTQSGLATIYYNRIGDKAQALVERYKPELHFNHDYTRSDRNDFEPRTVALMVDDAEKLVTTGGDIFFPSFQALVDNPGQDNYLDLSGSPANSFDNYIDNYLAQIQEQSSKYDITAYARVVSKAEDSDKTVIQYWLNYYYNNWYNNHEGDWEMVEVILGENLEPEAAAYSQHGAAFKKNWDEAGFQKSGTHPKVFVAEGSHANYFFEGSILHFIDAATPWGLRDKTGSESWTMPAVDMSGLSGGWADYAGRWGEAEKWWWPPLVAEAGPRGPVFQGDSWDRPLTWANASNQEGYGNDIILSTHSPAQVHLYDNQGNHVGKNASGGFDMQIPGSEYFERTEGNSRNIVVHNAGVLANYTVKIEGIGTGTMDLELQAPDFDDNLIYKARYQAVPMSPSTKAELSITPAKDFNLKVDSGGDGSFEELRPPDTAETMAADFTQPAATTDLSVAGVTSGSAILNWTAPGDNGSQGTAFRYDLRYSNQPITADNWQYATTASSLPDPQSAGSEEMATVTGLDAGTTYYFAMKAKDDSWQESPLSNVVTATTQLPRLTWSKLHVYWASWSDYQNRDLSVDYRLINAGTGLAPVSTVQASLATPDTVHTVTFLPLLLGDINPGASRVVTLKYYVPTNMGKFTTTTYATCNDDASRIYWYPGPK